MELAQRDNPEAELQQIISGRLSGTPKYICRIGVHDHCIAFRDLLPSYSSECSDYFSNSA
jgi:hypothetical protein